MTRVLVASDGSEPAAAAAMRARSLLGDDAELTVLRVVQPSLPGELMSAPAAAAAAFPPVLDTETDEQRGQRARREATGLAAALGAATPPRVLFGEPGHEICRLADEEGFDLIVVGSHGAGTIRRMLLGSVSDHVIRHATRPVLVVRDEAAETST